MIGKITSTFLGIEDHGVFTAYVGFDFGGSAQSAGGYAFTTKKDDGGSFGSRWIKSFIEAAGVDSWEKLKGRTLFVYRDSESMAGAIIGVGPLPTEPGKLFMFKDLSDEYTVRK